MLKERQVQIWAERVYDLRFRLGLTQDEFAKELNCTRVTVSNWEIGRNVPLPIHRRKIRSLEAQAVEQGL